MRTSPSQFEVMIDFMEQNGDLNKPGEDGPQGRLTALNKWQELTITLNLDTPGTAKPTDKWKKVWSDLKNNTKRKAAKIQEAVNELGHDPPLKVKLTRLEQRVLNIIGPSSQSTAFPAEVMEAPVTSPTQHPPSPRRQVFKARRWHQSHHSLSSPGSQVPPRRIRPNVAERHERVDAATEQFRNSDDEWRNLATKFINESLRLREVELQQQAQWQTLFGNLIEVLGTIKSINK